MHDHTEKQLGHMYCHIIHHHAVLFSSLVCTNFPRNRTWMTVGEKTICLSTVCTHAWTSGWGRCDNKCPESVALYIWHGRIIELIVFGMTERESEERSAVPECSLILFSIHCAQRLEAPEGSPARSLDALSHTLRQRDRTGGTRLYGPVPPPKGEDSPVSSESGSSGWTCGWGSDSRVGWGRFLSTCLQRRVGSDL